MGPFDVEHVNRVLFNGKQNAITTYDDLTNFLDVRLLVLIPRRQQRTTSFVFRDAFLGEELLEELFCWFARIPLHTLQTTSDAFDSFHSVLCFE